MFGKKKDNHCGVDSDLYDFLKEADNAYIRAFETRSVGLLRDLFSPQCCMAISQWIVAEASLRYFGNEKFRNTKWTVESSEVDSIVLLKECVYRDIKLSLTKTIKVSDDYKERWTVKVTPDEYLVVNVAYAA